MVLARAALGLWPTVQFTTRPSKQSMSGERLDGRKNVLGMWVGENESAKFWATVLNGLQNRGVEDIFIAYTDNLAGFDALSMPPFPE